MIQQRAITYFLKSQFQNVNLVKTKMINEIDSNQQRTKTVFVTAKSKLNEKSLKIENEISNENKIILEKIKLEEQRTHGLIVNMGISWYKAFEEEFSKEYFQKLAKFIANQRKERIVIYPEPQYVFTFTRLCELDKVKVVILGQDPYHQPKQAHGLCFSVRKSIPIPPSLQNIFQELKNDIPNFKMPKHGTLTGWAKQGVLLLNSCLTVEQNKANSHKDKGWENLTDAIIQYLNDHSSNIVFLLWGQNAQRKGNHINKTRHHVLTAAHPSPLSASNGFMNCKHFSKANAYLKQAGIPEINWSQLPPDDE